MQQFAGSYKNVSYGSHLSRRNGHYIVVRKIIGLHFYEIQKSPINSYN